MSLVAQYKFNGNANDSVGGYNGTAYNVTYSDAPANMNFKGGKAVNFVGTTSSYIFGPNIPAINGNKDFSVEFLYKQASAQGSNTARCFVSLGTDADSFQNVAILVFQREGYQIQYTFTSVTGATFANVANDVNVWHHLVCTYEYQSLRQRIYIDGKQAATAVVTQQPDISGGTYFGVRRPSTVGAEPWYPFYGSMANLRFYDEALSATTIANHYKSEFSPPPSICPEAMLLMLLPH